MRREFFIYFLAFFAGAILAYNLRNLIILMLFFCLLAGLSFFLLKNFKKSIIIIAMFTIGVFIILLNDYHTYKFISEYSSEKPKYMTVKVSDSFCSASGILSLKVKPCGGVSHCGKFLIYSKDRRYTNKPYNLIGCKIKIFCSLDTPSYIKGSTKFNSRTYQMSRGIFLTGFTPKIEIKNLKTSLTSTFKRKILIKRNEFIENINTTAAVKSFISGVLFGDKSDLPDEIYREFQGNGTAHILAVSGLHIGIIYSVYASIKRRFKSKIITILFIVFLLLYGTVTLWSPSVTRAIFLIFIKLYADERCLKFDLVNALSLIAFIIILKNPYMLFNISFQLSFLAVYSIAFFLPLLSTHCSPMISAMLAVQLGLYPYFAYVFNSFSPISLLCNPLIIFLTSLLVPTALFNMLSFLVFGFSPAYISFLLSALSVLTIKINRFFFFGGNFIFHVNSPPLILLILFYSLIFFFSSEKFLIYILRRKV